MILEFYLILKMLAMYQNTNILLKFALMVQICELRKVILEMRTVLYGDERSEPAEDACVKLTQEFFKEDTLRILIASLPNLDPGVCSMNYVYLWDQGDGYI